MGFDRVPDRVMISLLIEFKANENMIVHFDELLNRTAPRAIRTSLRNHQNKSLVISLKQI